MSTGDAPAPMDVESEAVVDVEDVSRVLDVDADDQPSRHDSGNQIFQKIPFYIFALGALVFWIFGVAFVTLTNTGVDWPHVIEAFTHALRGWHEAKVAVIAAAGLFIWPCVVMCDPPNSHGPKRRRLQVIGAVIVFITIFLVAAKPAYNTVYGGSVF
eukprot:856669_1